MKPTLDMSLKHVLREPPGNCVQSLTSPTEALLVLTSAVLGKVETWSLAHSHIICHELLLLLLEVSRDQNFGAT